MINIDIVQETFNKTIFPKLKKYIEDNSIYSPIVTKYKPNVSNVFPIVPIKLLPNTCTYNNLSYSEETYSLGIEIDINAQDKSIDGIKTSKRTICEEITSHVIKFFKENYRMKVYVEPNATSTDETVHRALIRVTGILDTKYGLDNLVIYPR